MNAPYFIEKKMIDFIEYAKNLPLKRLLSASTIMIAGVCIASTNSRQAGFYYGAAALAGMFISRHIANEYYKEFKLEKNKNNSLLLAKAMLSETISFSLLYSASMQYVVPAIAKMMMSNNLSAGAVDVAVTASMLLSSTSIQYLLNDKFSLDYLQLSDNTPFLHLLIIACDSSIREANRYQAPGGFMRSCASSIIQLRYLETGFGTSEVQNTEKSYLGLLSVCTFLLQKNLRNVFSNTIPDTFLCNTSIVLFTNILANVLYNEKFRAGVSELLFDKSEESRTI